MCGITGFIDWRKSPHNEDVLEIMTETLSHRGPDAINTWSAPPAALGHTRLIVVDPLGGRQPMIRYCDENRVILVYNGELYNNRSLRQELQARGHVFYSKNSDTEILLVSYLEWGEQCVEHFNGIFAFAIWDERKQKLFLARDRMGVKPLFYTIKSGLFVFLPN